MSTIKAGYRVTVDSWENDSYHWRTGTIDGLDEKKAKYVVDLLRLLTKEGGFGNLTYDDPDADRFIQKNLDFFEAIQSVQKKHGTRDESLEDCQNIDLAREILANYTGYSETYYTRVMDTIVVELVPEDIILREVTEEFFKEPLHPLA